MISFVTDVRFTLVAVIFRNAPVYPLDEFRGLVDTNLLRNLPLKRSEVQSPLVDMVAERLKFFGIFRGIRFWALSVK